jgi:hypothetical protein
MTTVWCHANGCDNLIRNDEEHLGTQEGNRTHVSVESVPYCMDCYDPHYPVDGLVSVSGVPVREDRVSVVIGGYPTQEEVSA